MTLPHSGWRWASLLAGVLALWLSSSQNGAPYIPNDGYQYLDAASNLVSGRCFCTRVALFDEQVAVGHFPIPFTHFAPGYPLTIAAFSLTGMAGKNAGYLLSALGFLAVIWLIQDIAVALGARGWVAFAFSLIWITHATALLYASTVGTESLFTALLLGLVALIIRAGRSAAASPVLTAGIGFVAGLSYAVRYPGLFLVAGAGVYLIVRAWRVPPVRRGALAGLLAMAAIVASIQIRNVVYTGSWRGGFTNSGRQSPGTVVSETIRSFLHLVTGDRVPLRFDVRLAILPLLAALVVFVYTRIARESDRDSIGKYSSEPLGWTLFIAFAYIGGVILATLTTVAADFSRYYFPIYPLLLAGAAAACSAIAVRWRSSVVVFLVLSVIAVEARNLAVPPHTADWIFARAMLAEEVQPGTPLSLWLRNHVGTDDAILAVEGQALHYVLQSPVVAVPQSDLSSRRSDGPGFHSTMRQFHAGYLLLFPNVPPERVPEQDSFDFLKSLASGTVPAWLTPAAHTRDAAIYECLDCVR